MEQESSRWRVWGGGWEAQSYMKLSCNYVCKRLARPSAVRYRRLPRRKSTVDGQAPETWRGGQTGADAKMRMSNLFRWSCCGCLIDRS